MDMMERALVFLSRVARVGEETSGRVRAREIRAHTREQQRRRGGEKRKRPEPYRPLRKTGED